MNKAFKKYKRARYKDTRLCPLNWTIGFLLRQYPDVTIELSPCKDLNS